MKVEVLCRMDYECRTLISWILEVSDVLSREVGEELELSWRYSEEHEIPVVYLDGEPALAGVPGEEGYLVEALKHAIESRRAVARESG